MKVTFAQANLCNYLQNKIISLNEWQNQLYSPCSHALLTISGMLKLVLFTNYLLSYFFGSFVILLASAFSTIIFSHRWQMRVQRLVQSNAHRFSEVGASTRNIFHLDPQFYCTCGVFCLNSWVSVLLINISVITIISHKIQKEIKTKGLQWDVTEKCYQDEGKWTSSFSFLPSLLHCILPKNGLLTINTNIGTRKTNYSCYICHFLDSIQLLWLIHEGLTPLLLLSSAIASITYTGNDVFLLIVKGLYYWSWCCHLDFFVWQVVCPCMNCSTDWFINS